MSDPKFNRNVLITITVSEVNGKLDIVGQIPNGAEDSIAVVVAEAMLKFANELLGEVMGKKHKFQIARQQ